MRKRFIHAALPWLLALTVAAVDACAAPQRRPEPAPSAPAADPASPAPGALPQGRTAYPTPRAGSAYDDPSTGIATVASAVPGAGDVRAVVLGNVAIIGTTSADPAVYQKVTEQIGASFAHIADVRFTNSPAHYDLLGHALSMLQNHQSLAPMLADLSAIGNNLPTNR